MSKDSEAATRIAFDLIGSKERGIAIAEFPEGVDEEKLAEEIMKRHKHVKSVIAKTSARMDPYRVYQFKLVAGDPNTSVLHKEHGYWIKLDPQSVYFSTREAEERKRIATKVKPGERVMIMFAGVGPYSIAIAKKQLKCEIVNVEMNPTAVQFAEENVKLNNLTGRIKNYLGDVRSMVKQIGKFDRIIMPLPETAIQFMDVAFSAIIGGGTVHLYGFSGQKTGFTDLLEQAKAAAERSERKIKVVGKQKVGAYAPHQWKVRLDLKVL